MTTTQAKRAVLAAHDPQDQEWTRYGTGPDALDVAHVEHDGAPWVFMRGVGSDSIVLVFTADEWTAFRAGARDGEFSQPFGGA